MSSGEYGGAGGVATVAGKWTRMENEMENFVPTTIFGTDSLLCNEEFNKITLSLCVCGEN